MSHEPELLTRQEAAETLRVSVSTLARLIKAGQLGHVRVGRQVRVPRTAVDRFIDGKAPEARPGANPWAEPDLSTWPPTESMVNGATEREYAEPDDLALALNDWEANRAESKRAAL